MKSIFLGFLTVLAVFAFSAAWCQEPPNPNSDKAANTAAPAKSSRPPRTMAEARRQAEVLHTAIHSTLQIVHDRYYREDEGLPIPAATMTHVFRDLEKQQQVKLRWLAVEGQAMNTDHKPKDAFEKEAFQALKANRPFYEEAKAGVYRRAGPITLSNHCLKCHVPDRRSTEDRTAGLIIQMSVQPEK